MDFHNQSEQPNYSPSTLIIFYDSTIGKEPLLKAIEEYKASIIYDLKMMNSITIKIPEGSKIEDAIEYFNKIDGVLQVNRDSIMQLFYNLFIISIFIL